ncbi:double-strand break repair helicase AddA [Novosphingobium tardum]|uniref:DNA 3'-5' helicase n=1 Tax=Novosphingobium tardum TaxID=1538021 RepID=A0ABV8RPQ9_9SPHN
MSEARVHPLVGNQHPAVSPEETVWLSASAGTGKTQVLSARVLRLLLQPKVQPEQILCLTFTKAGAAEMATRVNEVLASWVRLEDDKLAVQLKAIGASHDPATRARARSRFAAVLDCPGGGLRIQTIHAFAQWLLAAFPVEAGMVPGGRAMEDRDRELLVQRVLADLLVRAEADGDDRLFEALEMLSLRQGAEQVRSWLLRCAGARDLWIGRGAWQPPLRPRIDRLLGLGDNAEASLVELCEDGTFDCASLRACAAALREWGAATGLGNADVIAGWLSADAARRLTDLDVLYTALFTGKGDVRSLSFVTKKTPDYAVHAERVKSSIGFVQERRALFALADLMEPALALGRAFALAWDEAKSREGFIDFDDQIRVAADLLTRQGMADWVRFKLDRRFNHILIDEAQDTNAAQWEIVDALIGDFFAGEGQHGEAMRTLFVVGDYKQAIFRFQGTSPENFEAARSRVCEQMRGVRRELSELGLDQSFRTASPILEFVDRALSLIGSDQFGLRSPPDPHIGEDRPGLVALWRPVGLAGEDDDSESEPEEAGEEGAETWLSRPDRLLADQIARQVRAWLDHGFPLVKNGARMAGPGDVMVLVRKRKELAGLIVARLHAHGVAVAGVDRLRLGAPLGVKDIVAALRFAAQPLDSLNLAALLVSPIFGWTQEELLAWGYRSKGVPLWNHLRSENRPETFETVEKLLALLSRADFEPAHALLHWLLVGPWAARSRLIARLGQEVADPLDELLNAALAHAAANTSSLVGFLQWFDSSNGELKREAGRNEGLVRVMTVHGAKGLQSPIVILADAADDPDSAPPRGLTLPEVVPGSQTREIPVPSLRKAERVGPVAMAEARARQEERQEHWRLLYVAMTRAEEALFIGGSLGARQTEPPPASWYAALSPLFADKEILDDPVFGWRREWGAAAAHGGAGERSILSPEPPELPAWAVEPVGPEPRPPRPLAPSSLGEDLVSDPPGLAAATSREAAERGVIIHRLLERLPELQPAARHDAGRSWLEMSAPGHSQEARDEMLGAALAVLDDPRWQSVFSSESLAEVAVTAVVEGQVIAGTIDRLLIEDDVVRIVDFKSARRAPSEIGEVSRAYIRQMAAYAAALEKIYPGRRIEAALLYTSGPRLIQLSPEALAQHKPGSQGEQESFMR